MGRIAKFLADTTLPPQCLACQAPVVDNGGLCGGCWSRLGLISDPVCQRLGVPLAYEVGPDALSPTAIADPPPFERCRAVAVYGDISGRLVQRLKYSDQPELAGWLGGWMARSGHDLASAADVITPVPLNRWRLWQRRFNQSALLAQVVGQRTGKPVATRGFRRARATRRQVGLPTGERARNVRGAFAVDDESRGVFSGRRVLLIDDVYTTGATVKAATQTLLRAGAVAVDVLVFARVVQDRS